MIKMKSSLKLFYIFSRSGVSSLTIIHELYKEFLRMGKDEK